MQKKVLPFTLPGTFRIPGRVLWGMGWLIGLLAGMAWLLGQSMGQQREAFETNARIAHRLLSQRAVQHEAVLVTLRLMQPQVDARLAAVYPQFLQMLRRAPYGRWPAEPALAESLDAAASGAVLGKSSPRLAKAALASGRFWIVAPPLAGVASDAVYALEVSLPLMVPWTEWPFGATPDAASAANTRAWLEYGDASWAIHAGLPGQALSRFTFRKHLAADSQPFDLVVERSLRWVDLPWIGWAVWAILWSSGMFAVVVAMRQRRARKRAEELLRLGQVSRLNALGELAAGLAHELNQPLTAVLANTQAASRLLGDDEPQLETARTAMAQAVTQARRAAEVVARLRRTIERPNASGHRTDIDLANAAREASDLLEPECRKRNVDLRVPESSAMVNAWGAPVAVAQIIHNLISNALNALEQAPEGARRIVLALVASREHARLAVRDNGPGVAAAVAQRLFEPFVSGRDGGLGLGLSLCETLAAEMGGRLTYQPVATGGAEFVLELPLAVAAPENARELP